MVENPELENVTQIEQISDVEYRKDKIAFVIKPLHINQAHRWARWCEDRGFSKSHDKAFALAMDILENKTELLIGQNNRIETLEKLVYTHDDLLVQVLQEFQGQNEKQEEDPIEKVRRKVCEKRAMMEASKKKVKE